VVLVAPHQVEIGRRQHRDGDADVRHAPRHVFERVRPHGRELRHVADHHAPTALVLFGEIADLVDVEVIGGRARSLSLWMKKSR
jgi:hypothetical protein